MSRAAFCHFPLFAVLDSRRLDAWYATGREYVFDTGETLFQEGTTGTWMYVVVEGRVRVLRRTEQGREISLGTFGPGEFFGEYALLPPHINTATCRVTEHARLIRLPLAPLRAMLQELPDVMFNLKNWLRLSALVRFLRQQAFLGFMSAPSGLKFYDGLRPASFRALRVIQAKDLAEGHWYFIESGSVTLFAPDRAQGRPLQELGCGDSFGACSFVSGFDLPVAVAMTEVQCLCLERAIFEPSQEQSKWREQTMNRVHPGKYTWLGQLEEADCGVAALAMVLRHYAIPVSREQLRELAPVHSRGLSLLELQQLSMSSGIDARAVRIDPDHFSDAHLPVIALLTNGHYVVVFDYGKQGVILGDPATGVVILTERAFRESWSGHLLLLSPPHPTKLV